ncbi:MAG: hypothetical protein HRU03_05020, partial [Nanoarchaeales archaeon]|nr:hypothetical protein [Nanoarchaeales archaeon]
KKYKSYYGGEVEEISKLILYKQAQKEISPIFEKYIRSTKITEIETLIKKIITLRHTKENILIYFYI